MSTRYYANWLEAYNVFTQHLEAPGNIHFFSGVSAISSALNRKVFFDMGYFQWYPNFYIIIVGKAGLINKSTSIGVASDLLREVPGINIGPSSVTWQALVQHMGNVSEMVDYPNGDMIQQSALSFVASELGTLLDFHNREMIDVLVDLWDGKTGSWEKMTKLSGKETIVNPWIGLLAGTTPTWLAANVPESAIGGGFTSRCIFVYGKEKRHLTAYPTSLLDEEHFEMRRRLVSDLEQIAQIKGQYRLTPEAQAYGQRWYEELWTNPPDHLKGSRYEGYMARKQTHMHKLAMVFSAATSNELYISLENLLAARNMLDALENDMIIALDQVGRSRSSIALDQFIEHVRLKGGAIRQEAATLWLTNFCENRLVEETIKSAVDNRLLIRNQVGNDLVLAMPGTPLEALAKLVA